VFLFGVPLMVVATALALRIPELPLRRSVRDDEAHPARVAGEFEGGGRERVAA
jgi:hypothetical protein